MKKILIVSMTPSHPVTAGNRKWIISQVKFLQKLGHDVFFLYINCPVILKPHNDVQNIREMTEYWGDHLFVYKASLMSRFRLTLSYKIRKLVNKGYHTCDDLYQFNLAHFVNRLDVDYHFDICIVNYYWLTKLFDKVSIPVKVLNTHDCFSYKDLLCGKYAWMTTTPDEEAKALQRCDYVLALQKSEQVFFQHISPLNKVLDVYCFLDYKPFPIIGNKNIVLLSSDNEFNINGLNWFLKQVFPKIIKLYPEAKLIVGGSLSNRVEQNNKNVVALGRVDDVDDFFGMGDIAINPTYEGTGLKIKTFESISYDKVTIARIHSTLGIYNPGNAPIFASDNPDDWVVWIDNIWKNTEIIKSYKERNMCYMKDMNLYIHSQYDKILKAV